MKNKQYWKYIFDKVFKTGAQSSISLYLAQSSGLITADLLELIGVAFLTAFLSVIQNALLMKEPTIKLEDA